MATSNTPNARFIAAPDLSALPPSTLLTTAEAAAALGLAVETLGNWRCNGRHDLRFVKIGRRVRYRVDHLREWLAARTATHTGALPTNVA